LIWEISSQTDETLLVISAKGRCFRMTILVLRNEQSLQIGMEFWSQDFSAFVAHILVAAHSLCQSQLVMNWSRPHAGFVSTWNGRYTQAIGRHCPWFLWFTRSLNDILSFWLWKSEIAKTDVWLKLFLYHSSEGNYHVILFLGMSRCPGLNLDEAKKFKFHQKEKRVVELLWFSHVRSRIF
jgi:hypothetical protein